MQIWNLQASFVRPNDTTAYTANDLVANSTTAALVVPMSFPTGNSTGIGQFRINRARLVKSSTGVGVTATFRINLYETSPTAANGDNGAWSTDQAAHWLGNIDIASMLAFTDGAAGTGSLPAGSEGLIKMQAGKTIFGLLVALGAYVPVAQETFTVTLESLEAY